MSSEKIKLKISDDDNDVAYLYISYNTDEQNSRLVAKQVMLSKIIDNYKGPDIYLDFNDKNELIGMEILT